MENISQYYIDHLDLLNELIQSYTDNSATDKNEFLEVLLEFDLIINKLKDQANQDKDPQLIQLFQHFQSNLVVFYESTITEKQIELTSAWPIYINEFIANRDNDDALNNIEEYLSDPDWPASFGISEVDDVSSNSEILLYEEDELDAQDESTIENNDIQIDSTLNTEQQEFLDLINAEIADIQESHSLRLNELVSSNNHTESDLLDEVDIQTDQLVRIGSAAEMVGLRGLKKFCIQLRLNFEKIKEDNINQLIDLKDQLLNWPDIIQAYLFSPDEQEYILVALDYLNDDCWPVQLTPVEQKDFESAFYSSKVEVDTGIIPQRIFEATIDNVSLEIPEDVPEELFDSLLQDLPDQTAELSSAVQQLRSDDFIEQLEVSKRIAHTLKGAGNTVGVQGLANITHHLEDILEALLKEREKPTKKLQAVIESAADCLEEISEYLHGMGEAPKNTQTILQDVLDWANNIDAHGIPSEEDELQVDEAIDPPSEIIELTQEQTSIIDNSDKQKEKHAEASIRVATSLIDDLLKRAGENIISNGQVQEYIQRSKDYVNQLRLNNSKLSNLVSELEHLIEIRGISSRFSSSNKLDKFDPLEMDQFNELNTYANLLIETAADSNEFAVNIEESLQKLDNLSVSQKRTLEENQEAVLRTRMVPVKSILSRLKRSIKQANKISEKSARLEVTGEEVLVDSDILNQLVDPLMHILRNAVDHGIESSEYRIAQGKNENGTIKVGFSQIGKQIHISCEDDGRGLDIDLIKSKALNLGMLSEEQSFEKEDALKLILQHGFSTKENVTQLSGRGVGLDIVFAQIRDLKGSVSMDSTYGSGTKLELSIPITLHSTQALLASCGGNTVAISNRGIEEILHPGAGKVIEEDGKSYFAYKQKQYEIFDLQSMLFDDNGYHAEEPSQAIVIVKDEFNKSHAILLDRILDSREFVVKPFSRFIPKISGLLGSTIIGDGSVISVLDLLELVNLSDTGLEQKLNNGRQGPVTIDSQCVLIVEDAISTRKSLEQFMLDLGFKVFTAKDGVEAIDRIQHNVPSIILTDLEMPRMNGLELTDHLRSNEETKDTPIIMITSRATDKHKNEAKRIGVTEYMTKPYDEDLLLSIVNKYGVVA